MNEILNDISETVGKPRISQHMTDAGIQFKQSPSTSPSHLALEREKAALARYAECEEMDWHPTQPIQLVSQHRAFAPDQPVQRSTQLFGQEPVAADPSTFWYKVPPAPITPAHRLRNPPNQPRISPASVESKEKLFAPLGKRIPTLRPEAEKPKEYYLAQQKFFPVATRGVDENDLADMMGGFSLREDIIPPQTGSSFWPIFQCATICCGLAVAWSWYKGASIETV
jgi:hypothetical protein